MWMDQRDLKWEQVQILNENGKLVGQAPDIADDKLVEMYRLMVFARLFDERAVRLQRQGRIGTYAPFSGQEAAQIGSAFALQKQDWMFPSYREMPAQWAHGVPLRNSMLYSVGHLEGWKIPDDAHVFPVQIIIAGQTLHAMGSAFASKYLKDGLVSLCYLGDGATSQGDFHEAMNFASVFQLPVVYVVQNNQWAISVPRSHQSRSTTLAQKALAYGVRGVQVDGNDVLAVYKVAKEAIDRARAGEGPSLIEAVTFRQGAHTTSDDPTRYRTQEEVGEWMSKDPIHRFKQYLMEKQLWDDEQEEALRKDAAEQIEQAVVDVESTPKSKLTQAFDLVYSELPPRLKEQKQMAAAFAAEQEQAAGVAGSAQQQTIGVAGSAQHQVASTLATEQRQAATVLKGE